MRMANRPGLCPFFRPRAGVVDHVGALAYRVNQPDHRSCAGVVGNRAALGQRKNRPDLRTLPGVSRLEPPGEVPEKFIRLGRQLLHRGCLLRISQHGRTRRQTAVSSDQGPEGQAELPATPVLEMPLTPGGHVLERTLKGFHDRLRLRDWGEGPLPGYRFTLLLPFWE